MTMIQSKRHNFRRVAAVITAAAVAIAVAWLIEHFGMAFVTNHPYPANSVSSPVQLTASPTLPRASRVPLFDHPRAVPDISFADDSGQIRSLADFRGKVVLLNIWATWCVPCRQEMPTLDRLQAALGGPQFEVVALSIDRAGPDAVRKFYGDVAVKNLALYIDSTGKASRELAIVGLPTTLLIDSEGREIGRLVGPAEWDTPEMVAFLRNRLPGKSGAWVPGPSSGHFDDAAHAMWRHDGDRYGDLDVPVPGITISPASKEGACS